VVKKVIAPLIVCAVLLGGVGAGVAGAAVPASPTVTAKAHNTRHRLDKWVTAHRRQIRRAVVAISAKTIGVSRQDLVTELRSGKSIADVAAEHNVSAQKVVDALTGAVDAKVAKAVTNHKFTSTQAAKIEAVLHGYVVKLVNHAFGHKAARHPAPTAG
jgi:uncharacterized membrane protein